MKEDHPKNDDATPRSGAPEEGAERFTTAGGLTINPPVFLPSALALVVFLFFGVAYPELADETFGTVLSFVTEKFGWLYVASVTAFIVFALGLLGTRYGRIVLGQDDDEPDFSNFSWFAMLFSAGMGIGLVFYGVAEPMLHYQSPPIGAPGSSLAMSNALPLTYFHWGLHAWGIYVMVGMCIAYFAYRWDLPLTLRSCFYPLLGERIYGWPGHLIDITAVLGTLFGLAASLGFGAMQVSAGLHHLLGIPHSTTTQLVLIGVITLAATISLLTGVKKGIRLLSEANLALAACLLLFVFLVGPTDVIMTTLVESVGRYISLAFDRTLLVRGANPEETEWMHSWTLFYWGWWISWSPFVGMFIARISRGRTIREFVLGVLLVPLGVTFIWFSVFGGTALWMEATTGGVAEAVATDTSTAIYVMLERLPLGTLTSGLAALVVSIFFVTSSDSASFVVDILTSGGHPNPPRWQRVFWATAEGATAAVLLYAGGRKALHAIQSAVISVGLPFCVIALLMLYSLFRALRSEKVHAPERPQPDRRPRDSSLVNHGDPRDLMPDLQLHSLEQVQSIVVPVDRSGHAARALKLGQQLSRRLNVPCHAIHVAAPPADYLPLEEWLGRADDEQGMKETVGRAAAQAVNEYMADQDLLSYVEPEVVVGRTTPEILRFARSKQAGLLILGARGRGASSRIRLGTIAERVVRNAHCGVLLVR